MAASRNNWGNLAIEHDQLAQLRDANPGRVRAPRSAGELLRKAHLDRVGRGARRLERFGKAWRKAAGNEIGKVSEVTSYRQGELRITVTSSALAHEMSVHRAAELLGAVNKNLGGMDRVACLRFRAGKLKKTDNSTTENGQKPWSKHRRKP